MIKTIKTYNLKSNTLPTLPTINYAGKKRMANVLLHSFLKKKTKNRKAELTIGDLLLPARFCAHSMALYYPMRPWERFY